MGPLARLVGSAFLIVALVAVHDRLPTRPAFEQRLRELSVRDHETKRRSEIVSFPRTDGWLNSVIPDHLAAAPRIEPAAGVYGSPVVVTSSGSAAGSVRYTTDGSVPTARSPRLDDGLVAERTTVLRARSFPFGRLPSEVVTHTYVIGSSGALPIVSLVLDPLNLWGARSGIYENPVLPEHRDLWRKGHVELLDDLGLRIAVPVELKLHGGFSRRLPKKAFRLRFLTSHIEATDLDSILTLPSFEPTKRVVLRAGGNNWKWRLADELFNAVYTDPTGSAPGFRERYASRHEPVHLLLNGDYRGLYNLRESIDHDFLRRSAGPGDYDLVKTDLIERGGRPEAIAEALAGDLEAWSALLAWFRSTDLSDPEAYAEAARRIHIGSFTDAWLHNAYAANLDWPRHKAYQFRPRTTSGRWQWIAWDADQTFGLAEPQFHAGRDWLGVDEPTLARAVGRVDSGGHPDGTLIIRGLLRNEAYRRLFIARAGDLLNTAWLPERILPKLDALIAQVGSELESDLDRWSIEAADYRRIVDAMRVFIEQRPAAFRDQLRREFDLGPDSEVVVAVAPPGGGFVRVNTIDPRDHPWRGGYLAGTRLELEARPDPGFRFVEWSGGATAREFGLTVEGPVSVTAHFAPLSR